MLPGIDLRNGHFSLRPNTSEELFAAGLRAIHEIIARNNFSGINCVMISERRVFPGIFPPFDPSFYGIFWEHIFC